MTNSNAKPGHVAIIGAGPAGMATAISIHQAGHEVAIFERYKEVKPAGNILNLWPPPIKALGLMGVDIVDFGAPTLSEFHRADGRLRAVVHLPEDVVRDWGGGFIGLTRPNLFRRLHAALPEGSLHTDKQLTDFTEDAAGVHLFFSDGSTYDADVLVGADGIDSFVRKHLWGDAPKRDHNLLVLGGLSYDEIPGASHNRSVVSHDRTVQASWTGIREAGKSGYQWWVLSPFSGDTEFTGDVKKEAARIAHNFPSPLPGLIASTDPELTQKWQIRDRPPLKQWSKGRVTLVGDAAHSTSPYAAYGAGMATEDGYYLGRKLAALDLSDYGTVRDALQGFEEPRKPHTAFQSQMAYRLGRIFHHTPAPLRPIRDLVFDHTKFLQKMIGETTPVEILKQMDEIDIAEADFRSKTGAVA
ncbi:MAG: salicylate hydroxylase [Microbacteriaceae bacterium]|nr:salicylate hydroxylase [Microbacteriaceae bacterium]